MFEIAEGNETSKLTSEEKRSITLVMHVNYTYCDHFTIYTNIKSLCYILETDIICQLYLNLKKKKFVAKFS